MYVSLNMVYCLVLKDWVSNTNQLCKERAVFPLLDESSQKKVAEQGLWVVGLQELTWARKHKTEMQVLEWLIKAMSQKWTN